MTDREIGRILSWDHLNRLVCIIAYGYDPMRFAHLARWVGAGFRPVRFLWLAAFEIAYAIHEDVMTPGIVFDFYGAIRSS